MAEAKVMSTAWRGRWVGLCLAGAALGFFQVLVTCQPLPVLLVYGFQPIPGFRTTQLWEEFAEHLSGSDIVNTQTLKLSSDHDFYYLQAADTEHRDVFLSNYALSYEPTTRDIFFYTQRLAAEIAAIGSTYGILKLDVVAHSMGGLIARAYIEVDDFETAIGTDDFSDYGIIYGGEIRTLIMLATPNHGTMIASLGEWFSTLSRQLEPESEFLRRLNGIRWKDGRVVSLDPSVRYVSMAGQTCFGCSLRIDEGTCMRSCVEQGLAWNGSDLVVMMASAFLPEAENCALIGFDHISNHTDAALAEFIEVVLAGQQLPAAFYAPELRQFQPE